jgi:hypothetical protein
MPRPRRCRPTALAGRLLLAALLGVGVAVLVSCGSSGAGLIPAENAGPLESDFQAIARAAYAGNGSCTATETAIQNTESDFHALPKSIDAGLRRQLEEGISNLRKHALSLCTQPLSQTTTGESTSTTKTTAPSTTPKTQSPPTPTTSTGPTQTTPPTSTTEAEVVPTTPQPSGPGGGTPAPGVGGSSEGQSGEGNAGGKEGGGGGGAGEGAGNGGLSGSGGAGAGGGSGVGQ